MIVTVQSAKRPSSVKKLLEKLDPIVPVFYVPTDNVDSYHEAGATQIVPVSGTMPMKTKQLNRALLDNKGEIVVTMDDDLNGCMIVDENKKGKKIPFVDLLEQTVEKFKSVEAELAGFSTTANPYFLRTTKDESYGMLKGGILFHKPNPNILFDENMKELEDLEFIIQHHLHKGILKVNNFVIDFHFFGQNEKSDEKYSGGYSGYRTKETENETYMYLRKKHPSVFKGDLSYAKTADIYKKVDWKRIANPVDNIESFFGV